MFAAINKQAIHQQRLRTLLAQREQLLSRYVAPRHRLCHINRQILAHGYALSAMAPKDDNGQQLSLSEQALFSGAFNPKTGARHHHYHRMLELYHQAGRKQALLRAIFSLMPANDGCFDPELQLREARDESDGYFDLLIRCKINWPVDLLLQMRRELLWSARQPGFSLAMLLLDQPEVTDAELRQAAGHRHFPVALVAFIKGVQRRQGDIDDIFLQRYSASTDQSERRQMLVLGGLSGDRRWFPHCQQYCQQYPAECEYVMSHYCHKEGLAVLIALMEAPQCAVEAHNAWSHITGRSLVTTPPPRQTGGDHITQPDTLQARHIQQQLLRMPGERVLDGRHLGDAELAGQCANMTGIVAERADVVQRRSMLTGISHRQASW